MLYRYIFGDDIFVSYARADGLLYAQGLASELAASGFSCRIDLWQTEPGARLPHKIRRAVRNSSLLVVVGTAASSQSEAIGQEISEFLRTGRNLIPIGFPGMNRIAVWHSQVAGLPWASEDPNRLQHGKPSPAVLSRIRNSFEYTRRTTRLKRAAISTGLITAVFLVGLLWLSRETARQLERATAMTAIADSRSLAAQAMAELDLDPGEAMRLSIAAREKSDTFESRRALLASLQSSPRLSSVRSFPFKREASAWAIEPVQQFVAIGTREGFLEVWNYATGSLVNKSESTHQGSITGLAFSARDGRLASAASRGQIVLSTASSLQNPRHLETGSAKPGLLVFDSEGSRLAYGDDEQLILVDLKSGTKKTVSPRDRFIYTAAFSPDGKSLAWGDDNEWRQDREYGAYSSVFVTDIQTGETKELRRSGREKEAYSLAFSPDGAILATGWGDGRVILWRTSDYALLYDPAYISRHGRKPITGLAFSPDGSLLASLSADGVVLWSMDASFGTRVSPLYKTSHAGLTKIAFDRTGRTLHAVGKRGVLVWEIGSLGRYHPGPGKATLNDFDLDAGFGPAGKSFHASTEGEDTIWRDVPGGEAERHITGFTEQTAVLTRSPARQLAVIQNQRGVFLFDQSSGKTLFLLHQADPKFRPDTAAIDRQGRRAAVAGLGETGAKSDEEKWTVSVWDIQTRRLIRTAEINRRVSEPKFSGNGETLGFIDGPRLRFLSIATGKWRELKVHAAEGVESFAFAPDDRTLATGGKQGSVILWDFLSLKPKRAPLQSGEGRGLEFSVAALAFDLQGAVLAAAGGDPTANSIGLWDLGAGRLLGRLQASRLSTIWTVEFSGDGRVLASAGIRSDLNKQAASRGAWEYEIIFWDVAPDSWTKAARRSSTIMEGR